MQTKSLKNGGPGEVLRLLAGRLAPRCPKVLIGTCSGLPSEACWSTSWRQDGPSWGQDGAKLANLAPRCGQDGAYGAQDGQLARAFGRILATFFWILGAILPKRAKTRKTTTVHHFWKVLGGLGGLLEAMLAHLGAMLGYVGSSWRRVRPSWPILASSCDLLGKMFRQRCRR